MHSQKEASTDYHRVTGSIFLCIYLSKRRMRRFSTLPMPAGRRALATFLQSSAVYTVVLVALFVTYIIDVNPEMFGTDILTPIIVRGE